MINLSIHTSSPGHELEAKVCRYGGCDWVDIRTGEDHFAIHVGSLEHAQRIADACNWRQEPEPIAQPVPVDVELSPAEVVMASSLDSPCAPLEVDDDTPR